MGIYSTWEEEYEREQAVKAEARAQREDDIGAKPWGEQAHAPTPEELEDLFRP